MEDAFSTYTLGYFLKPVDEKRLAKAIIAIRYIGSHLPAKLSVSL